MPKLSEKKAISTRFSRDGVIICAEASWCSTVYLEKKRRYCVAKEIKFYITRAHLSVWVDPIFIVRIRRPNELNREGSAGSGMILDPCALRCAYFGSLLPLAYSRLIENHRVATCRSAGTNLARVNASQHRLEHRAQRDDFVTSCGENTCHPSLQQVTILCPAG